MAERPKLCLSSSPGLCPCKHREYTESFQWLISFVHTKHLGAAHSLFSVLSSYTLLFRVRHTESQAACLAFQHGREAAWTLTSFPTCSCSWAWFCVLINRSGLSSFASVSCSSLLHVLAPGRCPLLPLARSLSPISGERGAGSSPTECPLLFKTFSAHPDSTLLSNKTSPETDELAGLWEGWKFVGRFYMEASGKCGVNKQVQKDFVFITSTTVSLKISFVSLSLSKTMPSTF